MRRLLLILAAAGLLAGGCASSSDLEQIEDQLIDLHDEVTELKRRASSKEELEDLTETLATQTRTILQSNADLAVKVSEIDEKMQNTQGTIEQANYRIDRLVTQIAENEREIAALRQMIMALQLPEGAVPGETPPQEVTVQPPIEPVADPLSLYQSAYRDYQRGNFELAIEGFQEFLESHSSSDLADNAAYWIGESYYSDQRYRESVRYFDEVINRFPQSDKVPAALLKKGFAYIELDERAQGIVQLQYVVHEHPTSSEASLAREKLRSLGIESR